MTGPIALGDGNAAPEGFFGAELGDIAREILRTRADEALQYGGRPGYRPLRERVASWLSAEGPTIAAADINIVTGAKQALDLGARGLARAGDEVLLSEPTYMNALRIFRRAGLRILAVSDDGSGSRVDEMERVLREREARGERQPQLIYEIPDFHNPTGSVLAADRREKLVGLARRYGIPILEDNPYRWLRYEGSDEPPLRAYDQTGVVVSIGTFAKILGPGLRLGWIHARKDLLERVMEFKADGGSSPLLQMVVAEFFRTDDALPRSLGRLRELLRAKRDAMLRTLDKTLTERATWTQPKGGYYVWITARHALAEADMKRKAAREGVEYYAGSAFYADPELGRDRLRLCFAHEPIDRIEQGAAIVSRLITESARAPVA